MKNLGQAIPWAIAMIALASAVAIGWITDANAAPMFALIPALYVATSRSSRSCRLWPRKSGGNAGGRA